MKTFIIAEIGVNHNGSRDLALRGVEAAFEAGASAVKFQTFQAAKLVAEHTATVAYQRDRADFDDQHAMLRELELTVEDHRAIADRCLELGVEFMSTGFDSESIDMLCALGIKRIKVPSGEVTNGPFLRECAGRGLPVILSTGMADLDEVGSAVKTLQFAMGAELSGSHDDLPRLTVLHCTSAYPTALEDVNLLAMRTIATAFNVDVGYSDHTQGIAVAPLAVAMGACLIEKHFTLDRSMRGPDHSASLEPQDFAAMVKSIRETEQILGDGRKQPRGAEMEARSLVRRGLKAARDLSAGSRLAIDDVAILRPATGLAPERLTDVIDREIARDVKAGSPIHESDLI